jgi:hypothetical protein
MKPSTVYGHKQIWNHHLMAHFGDMLLRAYTADARGDSFSASKPIKGRTRKGIYAALAGAMFSEAVERGLINSNPWRGLKLPKDAIEPDETQHYTLEKLRTSSALSWSMSIVSS